MAHPAGMSFNQWADATNRLAQSANVRIGKSMATRSLQPIGTPPEERPGTGDGVAFLSGIIGCPCLTQRGSIARVNNDQIRYLMLRAARPGAGRGIG